MLLYKKSLKNWMGFLIGLLILSPLYSQKSTYTLEVSPQELTLKVGETKQIEVVVKDEDGNVVKDPLLRFFARGDRSVIEVDQNGQVTAKQGGEANVIVIRPDPEGNFNRYYLPVSVEYPGLKEIDIVNLPSNMYTGTHLTLTTRVIDLMDITRKNAEVSFSSSNDQVASINAFHILTAHQAGRVSIFAEVKGVRTEQVLEVVENPVVKIDLKTPSVSVRTGDVVPFTAVAYDASGTEVTDAPMAFSYMGKSANPSYPAEGMIHSDGRFVAYEPGIYSIHVSCGMVSANEQVQVNPRNVQRDLQLMGQGSVSNVHTSDLWVWEGVDGKDYCVTGTWGADGEAYFWDVTDPTKLVIIDTVKVDARTVNDVKISEDGKVCIISREGASNRKNGIVILDVTNPREVKQLSIFDEGLTGGVHNLFIYDNHVFALSNGRRYDVINIEDPAKPKKVGTFELDTPGHAIHDVWIEDGIAYSSNWHDGVHLVDVGNGIKGGTPEKPVKIASYAYPSGWNHAAFPYKSESTGKFYVIAGDEAFPNGINVNDQPTYPAGYLHVIDFTDMDNPVEVAHYEVPGAGSHNFWIEGDILYVANYNGGLRVVDISGDLLGNLYDQEREIAWFKPADPNGRIPNAPMTWGPQPHKGHIFISDWNSGLWSLKLEEEKQIK